MSAIPRQIPPLLPAQKRSPAKGHEIDLTASTRPYGGKENLWRREIGEFHRQDSSGSNLPSLSPIFTAQSQCWAGLGWSWRSSSQPAWCRWALHFCLNSVVNTPVFWLPLEQRLHSIKALSLVPSAPKGQWAGAGKETGRGQCWDSRPKLTKRMSHNV